MQLAIDIEPDKGRKTEDLFVPPAFHIQAGLSGGEGGKPKGESGAQPFAFPVGVGGVLMNGCSGTNYQSGNPYYAAKRNYCKR